MVELVLYGTSACHLCEQAKGLIWPVLEGRSVRLREVDIAESDALLECYGVRIPVLVFVGRELDWPFDGVQVRALLDADGLND